MVDRLVILHGKAATHTVLPKKQLDISILFLFVGVFGFVNYGLVLSLDVN
jgi:hypothetical protein